MFARCSYSCLALATLALCLPGSRALAQQEEPEESKAKAAAAIELELDESALEAAPQQVLRLLQASKLQRTSWIGMALAPADETLRAQLGLDEGTGVVVTAVVEDSPAAKAGVRKHDILVSVDEAPVAAAADVVKAVDAAGDKPITVTLLRGGEKTTLEVTPEKRRPTQPIEIEIGGEGGLVVRNAAEYLVRPGAILKRHATLSRILSNGLGELPENLSITITKSGKQPAQIVVKRDDENWEVTEDQLDELPDDVRPHVDRMLGRPPRISLYVDQVQQQRQEVLKQLRESHEQRKEAHEQRKEAHEQRKEALKQRIRVRQPRIVVQRAKKAAAQQRLDALSKQVEQLQRTIEELRRDLPDGQDGSEQGQ
jgi:hypothetical protein